MNLHILPDSKFSEAFYLNMKEAGLLKNNVFVVRTNQKNLKYVKQAIPFAPLYSADFSNYVGDTATYKRVFVHQLAPLMFRWIAKHSFRELHWMSWGTDLYNLPFIKQNFFEPETLAFIRKSKFDLQHFLYVTKVYVTNMLFKDRAYSKVNSLLTWMRSEVDFARKALPTLKARHDYFFYENQVPYERIDHIVRGDTKAANTTLKLIVGNSGTPSGNHLDAIRLLQNLGVKADLYIPVSYGEADYISFLKSNASFYKNGKIVFLDELMDFETYLRFLHSCDGLVMNHMRPQGYGNIFMMMYMNKPVLLNRKNISLPDLEAAGIRWMPIDEAANLKPGTSIANKSQIVEMLSHDKLITLYQNLFR